MVMALLDGRKSMTRRVLKHPKGIDISIAPTVQTDHPTWIQFDHPGGGPLSCVKWPYATGDRLYLREAWKSDRAYDDLAPAEMGGEEPLIYLADNEVQRWGWTPDFLSRWGRYRHARFMPRWASRLTLIVTDVRVQRLQNISEADAVAEGIEPDQFGAWHCYQAEPKGQTFWACPRESFRTLWNSLQGPDAWAANPWVVAISFTVHRRNIDQMEASQ
jgi:hypothetical protein